MRRFVCANLFIFLQKTQKSLFSNDLVELRPMLTGSHLLNIAPSHKFPIAYFLRGIMLKYSGNTEIGLPENRETGIGTKHQIRYVLALN